MALTFTIADAKGYVYYSLGFLVSFVTLLWLKFKYQYKYVAYFLSITGLALVSCSVMLDRTALHIIDPLWFVTISIYGYFTIGKTYGNILLSISTVFMMIYAVFLLNDNVVSIHGYTLGQKIAMASEFLICLFIVGYFIGHFLDSIKHAEQQVKLSNVNLQKQNDIISDSNDEKTILLQEIHHRVKNNLQVIVSLLRIQASEISSPEAQVNFHEAINRIMSMALIHQRMYEEKNLSALNVEDYFNTLLKDVMYSYDLHVNVSISVTSTLSKIGLKTVVPLGLMMTELVTNSLKHAFTEVEEGEIKLAIFDEDYKSIQVVYSDNGVWKAPSGSSFGMELIDTLTEQLDGKYDRIISKEGTVYQFQIANLDVDSEIESSKL